MSLGLLLVIYVEATLDMYVQFGHTGHNVNLRLNPGTFCYGFIIDHWLSVKSVYRSMVGYLAYPPMGFCIVVGVYLASYTWAYIHKNS